jgi:C-terminal processing protease CtpA/Prc
VTASGPFGWVREIGDQERARCRSGDSPYNEGQAYRAVAARIVTLIEDGTVSCGDIAAYMWHAAEARDDR